MAIVHAYAIRLLPQCGPVLISAFERFSCPKASHSPDMRLTDCTVKANRLRYARATGVRDEHYCLTMHKERMFARSFAPLLAQYEQDNLV